MVLVDATHEGLFVRLPTWRKAVEAGVPVSRVGAAECVGIDGVVAGTDTVSVEAAVAESVAFEGNLFEVRAKAELVGRSSRSTHVVADQSDHDIPLEQPHLVADAIRQVGQDAHR
jgi:hypothetical protein